MNLLVLGTRGLCALIDRKLKIAQALAREIADAPDFELLLWPEADILLFRFVPGDSYLVTTTIIIVAIFFIIISVSFSFSF
ncbi:hypothetical protein T492DRAFT_345415 [Pavlovales sp. CCMP2436]|nr:hypothetical protein T492DRAFT_345415 [Pavlovales sp. CCMP2436]